jgi:hypothetical protein
MIVKISGAGTACTRLVFSSGSIGKSAEFVFLSVECEVSEHFFVNKMELRIYMILKAGR